MKKKKSISFIILLLFMLTMILIIYGKCILGDYILLYPKVVSDGFSQFFPRDVNIARTFEITGSLFSISNKAGWGSIIGSKNPFEIVKVLFGADNVVYMYVVRTIIEITLGTMFFFLYLRMKNFPNGICIVSALAYGFSTQLIAASNWAAMGELMVVGAALLLSCECLLKKRHIWFVIFSVYMTSISLADFYILVYGAVIMAYLAMRFFYRDGIKKKVMFMALIVGVVLMVGVIVAKWSTLTDIFISQRFLNGVAEVKDDFKSTFTEENIKEIFVSLSRTFNPSIYGIPGAEISNLSDSYLSNGGFYFGILPLFFIPQIYAKVKKNMWYVIWLLLAMLLICCPGIRRLFNGMSSNTFKMNRMLITVILIICAAKGMKDAVKNGIDYRIMQCTSLVYIAIMTFAVIQTDHRLRAFLALSIVGIYSIILCNYERLKFHEKWNVILFFSFVLEIMTVQYQFVNNSDLLTIDDFNSQYYNDETEDNVIEIQKQDDSFYRIEKDYVSVYYSDAEYQNYNGVSYYKGGIVDDRIVNFIEDYSLGTISNRKGWFSGLAGNPRIAAAFSTKYLLCQNQNAYEYGWKRMPELGNVYQSTLGLQMGAIYRHAIRESDFKQLTMEQKKNVLSYACVVADDFEDENMLIEEYHTRHIEPLMQIEISDYVTNEMFCLNGVEKKDTVVISGNSDMEKSYEVFLYHADTDEHVFLGYMSIYGNESVGTFEISNVDGNTYVYLNERKVNDEISGKADIKVTVYDSEEYYREFEEGVKNRNQNAVDMSVEEGGFSGKIEIDKECIIYFPLMRDVNFVNYKCIVNGEEKQLISVNSIFSGLHLTPGNYDIKLYSDVSGEKFEKQVLLVLITIVIVLIIEIVVRRRKKYENMYACESN